MEFAIVTILLCFGVSTMAQTDHDWEGFKIKHKKNYTLTKEDFQRRQIWESHHRAILAHNVNADKGLSTFRQAPNHLTDLTDEEYSALQGAKPPTVSQKHKNLLLRQVAGTTTTKATTTTRTPTSTKPTTTKIPTTVTTKPTTTTTTKRPTTTTTKTSTTTTTRPTTTTTKTSTTTTTRPTTTTKTTTQATTTMPNGLPSAVDYRTSPCTAAIKNQKSCGSCWAFSATYETEFYNCQSKGNLAVLSEQNLVDCDPISYGCNGGWYDAAWDYVISNGQCPASSYAYTAVRGTCKRSSCTPAANLSTYYYVDTNATAIMDVVANIGPVSVAIDAHLSSFRSYASGVYADPACTTRTTHAINIVGYGSTAAGIPYWIIRNSWSTSWGMQGYGYIKRGVNMCGIEDWAAFPLV